MQTTETRISTENSESEFVGRHIGLDPSSIAEMLATIRAGSVEQLMEEVIPESIRTLPSTKRAGRTEAEALHRLRELAAENRVHRSYIGMGYYDCFTPSVILRNVLENPAWYTAYTPYQPEISQGRLECLLNFQTMVSDLTGLEIANASLLDEATAAAEAMALCARVSKSDCDTFFVANDTFPQTIEILRTRARPIGIDIVVGDPKTDLVDLECFGALFQYPASSGEIHNYEDAIRCVHEQSGLVVMAADLLSLTLLKPPGELGADIAVGTTQRFGVPLFYGGPHAAYMATKFAYQRSLPGRLIGVSVDAHGEPAYRMALQTREQHIRRDRATSNICTAQALLAIAAGLYAAYHGRDGLTRIADRIRRLTTVLALGLKQSGFSVANEYWFDTVTINVDGSAAVIHDQADQRGMNFRVIDQDRVGVSFDETTTRADVESVWACFAAAGELPSFDELQATADSSVPEELSRTSDFLSHPVFHRYHSETEMLRYLRRLADKDLALDRTMIPLGSCTMKLNAATEMLPVTWPEFADIHPYAPPEQTKGYAKLIGELESMLCDATGYDAVSLQPNAGSQGEFAGLLAIQAYHTGRGDAGRNICLIPESAHGTNPASATMAGLKIVVVRCDENGNVDVQDLRSKAEKHQSQLSCMMITYPSTHGVFEEDVRTLCDIIHEHGGQVYIDGANLNAQVGLCKPGEYGGDVSHLNLHKTFCIPHGGGGPGVGPIAVREHLAEYLPGSPLTSHEGSPRTGVGPVSGAEWGSAGILSISWAYIYMMGDEGLRRASESAIISANYIASRLASHFPVLYTGERGRVAHECILDTRPLKATAGVSVDDIAKRLIDYGFHAPTMSFPVPGTLMIEPTESESKEELDRFCEAMIKIRLEIQAIEDGVLDREDNPLKHAPHTAPEVTADDWTHAYSRRLAAYPVSELRHRKYWPPVGRVDHAFGDRNLMCSCPPFRTTE